MRGSDGGSFYEGKCSLVWHMLILQKIICKCVYVLSRLTGVCVLSRLTGVCVLSS